MSRENESENEFRKQSDLTSSFLQQFGALTKDLLSSINKKNPSRASLEGAIKSFRETIARIISQSELEENLLTMKERSVAKSFVQFQRIVDIMLSPQGLPSYVVKTFRDRFDYYRYYSDIPKEHLRLFGPDYFRSIIEYKFDEMPFVDLWGDARNLNWGGYDYIPGSSLGHYKDFTTPTFMQMFTGLEEDLGAKVNPDYIISLDNKIKSLRGTSAENPMYHLGFFLVTFDHFPGIVGIATVATNLKDYNYDFNDSELRKKFIETALSESGENFYITDFGLCDLRVKVSDFL